MIRKPSIIEHVVVLSLRPPRLLDFFPGTPTSLGVLGWTCSTRFCAGTARDVWSKIGARSGGRAPQMSTLSTPCSRSHVYLSTSPTLADVVAPVSSPVAYLGKYMSRTCFAAGVSGLAPRCSAPASEQPAEGQRHHSLVQHGLSSARTLRPVDPWVSLSPTVH